MNDVVLSVTENNMGFKLVYDHDAQSPLEDDDGIISHFILGNGSRYLVGDSRNSSDLLGDLARKLKIKNYQDLDQFELARAIQKKDKNQKSALVLPLYRFEHSGVAYSTSPFTCPWDSGQVGYVLTTTSDFDRIGHKWDAEQAKDFIKSEIDHYNEYLSGSCFGFIIESHNTCDSCEHTHSEQIESVWGYIGEQGSIVKMIASDYLSNYPELQAKVLESIQ